MELTLYHEKMVTHDGEVSNYRQVSVSISEEHDVIVYCCDINKAAEVMFGDRGVEFYLTVDRDNKHRLAQALGMGKLWKDDQKLLKKMKKKFGGKASSYEDLKYFLEGNSIDYQYDRW